MSERCIANECLETTGFSYTLSLINGKYKMTNSPFYILFLSPHSHIPSKIGIKDFPRSVKLYSTFGGICGYSFLCTNWSASNSFKVVLKVLYEISLIYFFISLKHDYKGYP